MILILTDPLDAHADRAIEILKSRKINYFRFHTADFPSRSQLSCSYSAAGKPKYTLYVDREIISLNLIESVWYRRQFSAEPCLDLKHEDSIQYVKEECDQFLHDVWNALDCPWLPASNTVLKQAQFKASQLKLAAELGFELPPTLVTNHPDDVLEFYRQHDSRIVSKLGSISFQSSTLGQTFIRYTEVFSRRDVGYFSSIRYCPMIFQAYIPKRFELRITVVGQKVFATEIHSQMTNHTRHDWRRYDHNKMIYVPHTLPLIVENQCIKLVQSLGLCFGAIDMILTPDGRYVFLEINPNGQYLWIEDATGFPISEAICDFLISGSSMNSTVNQVLKQSQETYYEDNTPICVS
jgi:hypothetical protein